MEPVCCVLMASRSATIYIDCIYIYIVTNSRPPACDRPRLSNSNRVAHRTDNSVVTFRNNAGTLSRVGLQPYHGRANFLPAQDRVNRRISIYLSTCAGSRPGDRTSAPVGLGHEPLKRSVPYCSDNRADIIARPRQM